MAQPTSLPNRSLAHRADTVGAFASFACAIHCVLLPFVITVLPFVGLGFVADSGFEIGMLVFTVTLATLSLCWGMSRVHGDHRTLYFLALAVIFFLSAHNLFEKHIAHGVLMGLGGFSLMCGHLLNRKLCRACHEHLRSEHDHFGHENCGHSH